LQQRSDDHSNCEELGNTYVGIHDEETSFQQAFDQHAGVLGGLMSFLKRSTQTTDSARELGADKATLLHRLTPNFLRSDEDKDVTSTCCPRLGLKQRLFGCACCFILGQVMQFCSFGAATGILVGRPGRFAFLYTTGNMVMMAASFFLSGPQQQCRKIKAKGRAATSSVYFMTMLMTMTAVFAHPFFGRPLVILLLVAVQWLSLVWYVLSYIPYGHTVGRRVVGSLAGWLCSF